MTHETLLLSRSDVADLLDIDEYIAAMVQVFKLHGEGKTAPPGILGVHAPAGGFHIKAGVLDLGRSYFAAKINANFPHNPQNFGLPTIQGVIVLADAENGCVLAVMDSIEITIRRTGAATAVAARYLARPNSRSVTIIGCGNQGRVSLAALGKMFSLEHVFAFDRDGAQAQRFASELADELRTSFEVVSDIEAALTISDICVTCTTSTKGFLKEAFVQPGTFVAAVGADSETKQELEPALLAHNKTVVDVLKQCATIGELHHAIDAGLMSEFDVHAELGEIVAGVKPGRTSSEETIIFDSTGMALQDVITAAMVYEKATGAGVGTPVSFS